MFYSNREHLVNPNGLLDIDQSIPKPVNGNTCLDYRDHENVNVAHKNQVQNQISKCSRNYIQNQNKSPNSNYNHNHIQNINNSNYHPIPNGNATQHSSECNIVQNQNQLNPGSGSGNEVLENRIKNLEKEVHFLRAKSKRDDEWKKLIQDWIYQQYDQKLRDFKNKLTQLTDFNPNTDGPIPMTMPIFSPNLPSPSTCQIQNPKDDNDVASRSVNPLFTRKNKLYTQREHSHYNSDENQHQSYHETRDQNPHENYHPDHRENPHENHHPNHRENPHENHTNHRENPHENHHPNHCENPHENHHPGHRGIPHENHHPNHQENQHQNHQENQHQNHQENQHQNHQENQHQNHQENQHQNHHESTHQIQIQPRSRKRSLSFNNISTGSPSLAKDTAPIFSMGIPPAKISNIKAPAICRPPYPFSASFKPASTVSNGIWQPTNLTTSTSIPTMKSQTAAVTDTLNGNGTGATISFPASNIFSINDPSPSSSGSGSGSSISRISIHNDVIDVTDDSDDDAGSLPEHEMESEHDHNQDQDTCTNDNDNDNAFGATYFNVGYGSGIKTEPNEDRDPGSESESNFSTSHTLNNVPTTAKDPTTFHEIVPPSVIIPNTNSKANGSLDANTKDKDKDKDSTSMSTSMSTSTGKYKPRVCRDWRKICTYPNFAVAKKDIMSSKAYTYRCKTESGSGTKTVYACKWYQKTRCPVALYVLQPPSEESSSGAEVGSGSGDPGNEEVSVYETIGIVHNHTNYNVQGGSGTSNDQSPNNQNHTNGEGPNSKSPKRKSRLSDEVQNIVRHLFTEGIRKPTGIMATIAKRRPELIIEMSQLKLFVMKLKQEYPQE